MKPGFYWLSDNGGPSIARFDGEYWWMSGEDCPTSFGELRVLWPFPLQPPVKCPRCGNVCILNTADMCDNCMVADA
jgi:hypothetical protein